MSPIIPTKHCAALAVLAMSALAPSARADGTLPRDVLYVESNSTVPGKNAVLAYRRAANGSLTPLPGSPFLTGGTGWFDPTYAVGPFDGDGIMAADPIGGVLFVPNGGSRSVAALRMQEDGSLTPIAGSPFPVRGNTPNSLALRERTLVIVDNGKDPKQAGAGFAGYETARLNDDDQLLLQEHAVKRPASLELTQALAVRGSPYLLTNEFLGGTVVSYNLDLRGALRPVDRKAPSKDPSSAMQPVPLGLAVHPFQPAVYAALPNVGRLGVYGIDGGGKLNYWRSVPVSGKAPCWIYPSPDGRFLYVVNTVDNSISVMDINHYGTPVEIQHLVLRDAGGFSYQIAASPDGRFLYTVEEEGTPAAAGLSNKLHIFAVDRFGGKIFETAASPVKLPVPAGNRPQGLIVF